MVMEETEGMVPLQVEGQVLREVLLVMLVLQEFLAGVAAEQMLAEIVLAEVLQVRLLLLIHVILPLPQQLQVLLHIAKMQQHLL